MRTARLGSVNVVHALIPHRWEPDRQTAIDKRPIAGRAWVHPLGVKGDQQIDRRVHGGPDKALYAYSAEDASWWERELGRELPPGAFGENLTTTGLDITDAVIGEVWRLGTAVVQVSMPRYPCRTFAGFWDVADLIKRFIDHGAPGAYLRVLQPGELGAGDQIVVEGRRAGGTTIGDVFTRRRPMPDAVPM